MWRRLVRRDSMISLFYAISITMKQWTKQCCVFFVDTCYRMVVLLLYQNDCVIHTSALRHGFIELPVKCFSFEKGTSRQNAYCTDTSLLLPQSSAEVKEREELNLCCTSGPSWPVLGWTLLREAKMRTQILSVRRHSSSRGLSDRSMKRILQNVLDFPAHKIVIAQELYNSEDGKSRAFLRAISRRVEW
jgi:hypothetical protein